MKSEYYKSIFYNPYILFFFLGLLAYFNSIFHPFVHDDVFFITLNPNIHKLDLKEIFLSRPSGEAAGAIINTYYRPFLELYNRLLFRVFEYNAYGFHFVNVLIHIANSILTFNLIRFILKSEGKAFFCALLFLLHPIQTEAVACVSGISNLLFYFFSISSFCFYLRYKKQEQGFTRKSLLVVSALLFLIGLFAKEQTIVLIPLIILYEFILNKGRSFKDKLISIKPIFIYMIIVFLYFAFRKFVLHVSMPSILAQPHEFLLRVLAIPKTLLMYLSLIIFPRGLYYYRSTDILEPYLLSIIVFTVLLVLIVYGIHKYAKDNKRPIIFGLIWFIVSFGPTLNIVPLINEYSLILTSEHFLYMPLVGILIILSSINYRISLNFKKSIVVGLCAIFLFLTIKQNSYWSSEIKLFKRTLQFQPNFARANSTLANAYYIEGDYKSALKHFLKAFEVVDQYYLKTKQKYVKSYYKGIMMQLYLDIGSCYEQLGDYENARNSYLMVYSSSKQQDPNVINKIALVSLKANDFKTAEYYYLKIIEKTPNNLYAINSLAMIYIQLSDHSKAELLLRKIVEKDPNSQSAKDNLKNFLDRKNRQP